MTDPGFFLQRPRQRARLALRTSAALLALALACALPPSAAHAEEPVIGQPHPMLRLPTIDGRATVDLAAQRGTKILLIQFASW
ncbi:MAG: hypothetical protein O2894_09325 [Planctomycetota bacterium]|nr:hypothetical protein [Planctomycetota bacterium]